MTQPLNLTTRVTVRANRQAFERLGLKYRVLVDVSHLRRTARLLNLDPRGCLHSEGA